MKRLLLIVISNIYLVYTSLIFTPPALAQNQSQFTASYNVTYDVGEDGVTTVREDVRLRNLTDRFYASSFDLNIGASQIYDVSAQDSSGKLETSVTQQGTQSNIKVKFAQQVAGVGKEYPWTLTFKSKDFAQKQGKIWQISIPKISSSTDLDAFNLDLSVPVSFGDPAAIQPDPASQKESGGKIIYTFAKNQLLDSGILASFGTSQTFKFDFKYNLKNEGFLPKFMQLSLPSNNSYQDVLITSINPKPENVIFDSSGNQIAIFKLGTRSSLDVFVSGLSKIYTSPKYKDVLSADQIKQNTKSQSFWEVGNPILKLKVQEILGDKHGASNQEKASLINRYVTNTLKYNSQKQVENQRRLGALTALNNSESATCSEFSDLFIALSRTANIPSREIIGFGYTANKQLRPLSFNEGKLHCWAQYFDSELGWVMVDPTWQQTTGGVDYFNKFDLNHLAVFVWDGSSNAISYPNNLDVNFSEELFSGNSKLELKTTIPDVIYGVIPSKIKISVENNGSTSSKPANLLVNAAKLQINPSTVIKVPTIPAFGHADYEFSIKSQALWQSFDDVIDISIEDQKVARQVTVKPFFALRYFAVAVTLVLLIILAIYFLALGVHIKSSKNIVSKVSKKSTKKRK